MLNLQNDAQKLDLSRGSHLYAESIAHSLKSILSVDFSSSQPIKCDHTLVHDDEVLFSILFTGQIYGEFIIGLKKSTALSILGMDFTASNINEVFQKNRQEVIDTFKEIINIAAGKPLTFLKDTFPDITMTPPRSIEGKMTLSEYDIYQTKLTNQIGELSCYLYVDYVRLDITTTLKKEKDKQEELKRLNKAKSEFLSNMSHELRTPLNGMIGMLDVIKTTELSELQRDQINIVCNSGDFLLSIINDILDFSKIEAGKLVVEKRPFNLRSSLEAVSNSLAEAVYAKNLDFDVYIDPQLSGNFIGDETRIKQVIANLVGNAIKFTPKGTVSLHANYKNEILNVKVIDTGIGIPASKLNTIFESFSQADVSDNRKYGGSGLGLTISRSIVSAMNGQLFVKSTEAIGSEFSFEIPMKKDISNAESNNEKIRNYKALILTENKKLAATLSTYLQEICDQPILMIQDHIQSEDEVNNCSNLIIDGKIWLSLNESEQLKIKNAVTHQKGKLIIFSHGKNLIQIKIDKMDQTTTLINTPIVLSKLRGVLNGEITKPAHLKLVSSQSHTDATGIATEQKTRVLLVEDNQINQAVASAMLQKLGYTVEIADNGSIALDKVKSKVFDIILMDCQMPIMNGYEATEAIRKLEDKSKSNIPIIALTANAFREIKERCFECGMTDFLTKPLKQDSLKDAINLNLKNAKTKMSS